jgi:hypothetical protein
VGGLDLEGRPATPRLSTDSSIRRDAGPDEGTSIQTDAGSDAGGGLGQGPGGALGVWEQREKSPGVFASELITPWRSTA